MSRWAGRAGVVACLAVAGCATTEGLATPDHGTAPAPGSGASAAPTAPPPSAASVVPSPASAPPSSDAAACIAQLPLAVSVGQVVWPAISGNELRSRRDDLQRWLSGGVVLMTWTSRSTAEDLRDLKASLRVPLLVATDEEGGSVQRLKAFGALPSAQKMASTHTPDEARALIAAHAEKIHELGIDITFAPVVDVSPERGSGPIKSRAFSADPEVVTRFAEAYVDGWTEGGVLPVLKHFPGHGSASADTHVSTAVTPSLDDLRRRDLVPYLALAAHTSPSPAVMVGHLTVPGLTEPDLPTSLSPATYSLLRGEAGYADALVFTDALGMDAIVKVYDLPTAAAMALAAGADVVIFTNTDSTEAIIAAISAAVADGTLPQARLDDAVGRVLRTKHVDPCELVG